MVLWGVGGRRGCVCFGLVFMVIFVNPGHSHLSPSFLPTSPIISPSTPSDNSPNLASRHV